ncbi:carbamoyltransferase [Pectobacterium aroidearum]|uniref:carbamoyltransferase family protein n=1 Tax=Pectobacterium aroidearum TaxID=1201031 RepID=UPI003158F9D9
MERKEINIGLSCFYHDSAVALMVDSEIIAALQEERFSRIKQDKNFPELALKRILKDHNFKIGDISNIFYYEDPDKKFSRIETTYNHFGIKGIVTYDDVIPLWLSEKKNVKKTINEKLVHLFSDEKIPTIHYIDHHKSHAASAFYPSPFESAAILCIDGVGEWATTSAWLGKGHELKKIWEIKFPHSLGLLYSAFTWYCGFKVDSGEYKLMGLAPYGKPIYIDLIKKHIIKINEDGSFNLNMKYFDYAVGNCMISDKFEKLFRNKARKSESELTQHYLDVAASIQIVVEEVVSKIARNLQSLTGQENLCMAGGVALNCVSNGKLAKENIFKNIWIQPAAGDAGGAIGAVYAGVADKFQFNKGDKRDRMQGSYLGTDYDNEIIKEFLNKTGAVYHELDWESLIECVVDLLNEGKVIGWFQGKMEFGPRALGNRSIIGDPRNKDMQSLMNIKIKNRESFRPFAPIVMEEHASEWFDIAQDDEYMLFVTNVSPSLLVEYDDSHLHGIEKLKIARSKIPAVTHVDNSARVQVLRRRNNKKFHDLLTGFYKRTGCPVLINTSFNVRGEPIVESPHDAYKCFMRTHMDALIMGNTLCIKFEQPNLSNDDEWLSVYTLD